MPLTLRSVLPVFVVAVASCDRIGGHEPFSSAVVRSANEENTLAGVAFNMDYRPALGVEAEGWRDERRVRLSVELSQLEVVVDAPSPFWRELVGHTLLVGDDRARNLRVHVSIENWSEPAPQLRTLTITSVGDGHLRGRADGDLEIDFDLLLVQPGDIADPDLGYYLLPEFHQDLVRPVAKPIPANWDVEVLP